VTLGQPWFRSEALPNCAPFFELDCFQCFVIASRRHDVKASAVSKGASAAAIDPDTGTAARELSCMLVPAPGRVPRVALQQVVAQIRQRAADDARVVAEQEAADAAEEGEQRDGASRVVVVSGRPAAGSGL